MIKNIRGLHMKYSSFETNAILVFTFLAMPHGMWDLSSLIRKLSLLTIGPPLKS